MLIGLGLILLAVLFGPVLVKPIEHNIEVFFLIAGTLTAAVTGQLGWRLIHAALTEPIALTIAVLIFGAVFRFARPALDAAFARLTRVISPHWIYLALILILGLFSSVITAVIAALVLVEAIDLLHMDRRSEIGVVVLACFAIGLGAALTPIGEPLGTIAISALKADFWYLARLLGPMIVAGIAIVAAVSLILPAEAGPTLDATPEEETWGVVLGRAAKVYVFVVGLVGLSWGLRPLVDEYISKMPHGVLFWLNGISAVVDNATLTAAEIGPALTPGQQRGVLMGLLISGGMLIPGNIPNIVAANRLRISSREWAMVGLPVGLPLMALCFAALMLSR